MNWSIASLDRTLPDGVIYTAHWRVSKTDGDVSASIYGTIQIPVKAVSDPDFIPYEDLTEADVVSWVQNEMGPNQVSAYEAAVQAKIDAQVNPPTASGLPWSNT